MAQPTDNHADEEKKHSLGARALVALAFSTVAAKIGTLGLIADARDIYATQNLTFWQKIGGVFNGKFNHALMEKIGTLVEKEKISPFRAFLKASKWTLITTSVAAAGGFAIGWARGGKIENWKDILVHPIRSTKLIFGFGSQEAVASEQTKTQTPEPDTTQNSKWADYHKERQATQESKTASSGASL